MIIDLTNQPNCVWVGSQRYVNESELNKLKSELATLKAAKPEPKPIEYREPTQADAGRMVEVFGWQYKEWASRKLVAVLPSDMDLRFICRDTSSDSTAVHWKQARIKTEEA